MHRGWVKQWRKEKDSAIWSMSPLHYKVWRWLLIEAKWDDGGELTTTLSQIAEGVEWVERRSPRRPHKRTISAILDWLQTEKMIDHEHLGIGNAQYTKISICNYDTYNSHENPIGNAEYPQSERALFIIQELKEVQRTSKIKPPLPPECQQILDANWLAHAPLPASSQTPTGLCRCLGTLRLLHTADGLPWPEVARITEHAAKVWQPAGYIGSPASLRSWTAKKDRRVWESIKAQMSSNGQPKAAGVAKAPPAGYRADADGVLHTIDPSGRLPG